MGWAGPFPDTTGKRELSRPLAGLPQGRLDQHSPPSHDQHIGAPFAYAVRQLGRRCDRGKKIPGFPARCSILANPVTITVLATLLDAPAAFNAHSSRNSRSARNAQEKADHRRCYLQRHTNRGTRSRLALVSFGFAGCYRFAVPAIKKPSLLKAKVDAPS